MSSRTRRIPKSKPVRIAPDMLQFLKQLAGRLADAEGRVVSLADASARLLRWGHAPMQEAANRAVRRVRPQAGNDAD